jgi:hypothetical protein
MNAIISLLSKFSSQKTGNAIKVVNRLKKLQRLSASGSGSARSSPSSSMSISSDAISECNPSTPNSLSKSPNSVDSPDVFFSSSEVLDVVHFSESDVGTGQCDEVAS